MIKDEGIKSTTPSQFQNLTTIKFTLTILSHILLWFVYLSYDNNIFSSLNQNVQREDDAFKDAEKAMLWFLGLTLAFNFIDIFIQIWGITYCNNRFNIINILIKLFEVFLLLYYYLDAWNFCHMLYIFIFTQLPCVIMEGFAILTNFRGYKKYNIIRSNDTYGKKLEKNKSA